MNSEAGSWSNDLVRSPESARLEEGRGWRGRFITVGDRGSLARQERSD